MVAPVNLPPESRPVDYLEMSLDGEPVEVLNFIGIGGKIVPSFDEGTGTVDVRDEQGNLLAQMLRHEGTIIVKLQAGST